MAKHLLENPMLINLPKYQSPEPVVTVKAYPVCQCGCGEAIETVEFMTHEKEPLASEACYMRISYKEGWIRKVAV